MSAGRKSQLLPGLLDVIGRPVTSEGITFIPILGRFRFSPPRYFLHYYRDLSFLSDIMRDVQNCETYNSLWVRARILNLFGIDHPSGHSMSTLLNFLCVAIDLNSGRCELIPFLISDTWNGFIDNYGHAYQASVAFQPAVPKHVRVAIAARFWDLLLSDRTNLGVFSDHWVDANDECLYAISSDGHQIKQTIAYDFFPPGGTDEWAPFPFELPRKCKVPKWSRHL